MTSMSDDYYEEEGLVAMIDTEDEPTTHSFDPARISFRIHFIEKQLSSPFEHPLSGRVKSGIRKPKDLMNRASKKQVEGAMLMISKNDVDDNNSARITSGLEQQKRCRHLVTFEPLDKKCVESSNHNVLLVKQGGQSNSSHSSTTIVHRHQIEHEEHQREYKRLKIDVRNEVVLHGNSWLG